MPSCIDFAIARSLHQGLGLRFPRNERTDEVNKLFIIWPFSASVKKKAINTPDVTFHIRLRVQEDPFVCGSLRRSY